MIVPGGNRHFPISIFVVDEDKNPTLRYLRYHARVLFYNVAAHRRDGPWGSLGPELFILMGVY